MDYHCNSINPVAVRLFRSEHQPKLPANRQLDSHSARYCRYPNCFEAVGGRVDPLFVENRRGCQISCLFMPNLRPVDMGTDVGHGVHFLVYFT